jgi:hypothetical protein
LAVTGFFLYGLLQGGTVGDTDSEAGGTAARTHVTVSPMRRSIPTIVIGTEDLFIRVSFMCLVDSLPFLASKRP